MLGFGSKPNLPMTQAVLVDEKTKTFWPTECSSEEVYTNAVITIKEHLRKWMNSDIFYITSTNQKLEDTLSYQIGLIPILQLPNQAVFDRLIYLFGLDAINNTNGRFIDACVSAIMDIPPEAFYCIRGRFLVAVTEGLYRSEEETNYPSKAEWVDVLTQVPWIPFLKYIQEMFEHEQQFQALREKIALQKAAQVTSVSNRT